MEESPDYKRLFQEAERARQEAEREQRNERERRQAAERAQQEAERAQQEAERAQQEAKRAQQEAERAQQNERELRQHAETLSRRTTLPEYLHLCHKHLYGNLFVGDESSSTRGDPSNATFKKRPDFIRPWHGFPDDQWATWDSLMATPLATKRLFASRSSLEQSGRDLGRRKLGSEMDLQYYIRLAEEVPVTGVVEQLTRSKRSRDRLNLRGSVAFENHSNTLSTGGSLNGRRRSPRLRGGPQNEEAGMAVLPEPPPHPRADQICVYNVGGGHRVLSCVSELKAPHKLPLDFILGALCVNGEWASIDVDDIVCSEAGESPQRRCQRLIAAVITQAFSYMVFAGLQYGCVTTGMATIFLQVLEDEPGTVQYFVSVPSMDVGQDTGWTEELDADNRLHLTAVGQMIAFTLRALQARQYSQAWRDQAMERLKTWEISIRDVFEEVSMVEASFSQYSPSPRQQHGTQRSPIMLRKRVSSSSSPSCSDKEQAPTTDDDSGPDTPSRRSEAASAKPRGRGQARKDSTARRRHAPQDQSTPADAWCTHACLLSLRDGGMVDEDCPNAAMHGSGRHQLTRAGFLKRVQDELGRDLDSGCQTFGRHGRRGVFFRIKLAQYGYTVAAKGTPDCSATYLHHETAVYCRLRPIQGQHVPVCLGMVKLTKPYRYELMAEISHLLLLSFAGHPITSNVKDTMGVKAALDAVVEHGVSHGDIARRNVLFDERSSQIMVIDFDRAKITQARQVLRELSTNRRRKRARSDEIEERPMIESKRILAKPIKRPAWPQPSTQPFDAT